MNILYVSEMSPNSDTGLYWSVPNQVLSQSKHDNVLWLNIKDCSCPYWEDTGKYITSNKSNKTKLSDLPSPFDIPDLVVFEGFYQDTRVMYKEVRKKKIPYIIVPRCSLTWQGQRKHRIKKIVGNIYFFNRFAKNAIAIHYLTADEKNDSGDSWNKRSFVMPNGVVKISDKQWHPKSFNDNSGLRGVFIGRISVYHKGLDLLVSAVEREQAVLRKRNVTIDIYGPDRENQREHLESDIKNRGLDDILIVHHNSIFGEEKERILLSSDFFVLTSRLEGHPMGLIEALSYGVPSLITRGSNMMNEIEEYKCGWCAETDEMQIAKALVRLTETSDTELSMMSEQAIQLAKQYQWEKSEAKRS